MEIANDELTRSLSTDSNAPSIETIYSRLQRQGALRGLVRIFVKSSFSTSSLREFALLPTLTL